MNIALCTDDNYANHCAVCVTSILENNKSEECHIYVLTEGLTEENVNKFKYLEDYYHQKIDVKNMETNTVGDLQVSYRFPRSIYFRFLLPQVIAGDRVLYLDCDIIVRTSLSNLFKTNLDGFACGVVEDQCGDDVRLHNPIMMFSRYFNSGMLLMNLDYWRRHDVAKNLVTWIENFDGRLLWPDQDALNAVLEGKVRFLDYKYNYQQGFFGDLTWLRADKWPCVKKAKNNPVIVHYTAGVKPWHKDCKHPMKGEYDVYMNKHSMLFEVKRKRHSFWFYVIDRCANSFKNLYNVVRTKAALSRG